MRRVAALIFLFISPGMAHKAPKEQNAVNAVQLLKKQREEFLIERTHLLEKIAGVEEKRREFSFSIEEKKQQLSSDRKKLASQVPLLIRLARFNPLRLLVDSKSTQNAIRGVVMVRALTTALAHHMKATTADLHELMSLDEDLDAKARDYQALLQDLEIQREQLKLAGLQAVEGKREEELQRLAKTNDVSDLLEESQLVLSQTKKKQNTSTKTKGLPFGRLEYPVVGKIMRGPNLQKKFSPQSQGVVFKTQKNATVLAPAKGVIVFRGPFLSQPDIIIINHGNHVHTVLMGMDKIYAEVGKTVYAGEKLGSMAGYGKTAPLLYLELRQKGKSIDPAPYFTE